MGKHLEAEVLVLVQDLQAARHVVAAGCRDEVLVGEQPLEMLAHVLAALGARIALQDGAAVGDELVELVGHVRPPGCSPESGKSSRNAKEPYAAALVSAATMPSTTSSMNGWFSPSAITRITGSVPEA